MSASPTAFLETPLLTSPGIPLRVAVYSRISQGIRSAVFPMGSALPRETELAAALNVSRTVVREALMLLEEDGLIRTRRGVGRFVAENTALPGLEELRPLEDALRHKDAVLHVRHLELSRQEPTDFVSDHLALAEGQQMWFREAVIEEAGTPIALIQEYLAVDDATELGLAVTRAIDRAADSGTTVLHDLMDGGLILTGGACQIGTNVAGSTRARHLQLAATTPVLVLTQTAQLDESTVYLAKCAVVPSVGHVVVRQSTGA